MRGASKLLNIERENLNPHNCVCFVAKMPHRAANVMNRGQNEGGGIVNEWLKYCQPSDLSYAFCVWAYTLFEGGLNDYF